MLNSFPEEYLFIGAFIASLLITWVSIPSIIKVAELKHLFDEPGERTVHSSKIPTLGGLAIFSGVSVSSLVFCDISQIPEIKYIVAGIIILFFVGIKDDILIIAPFTKLSGQILAVLGVVLLRAVQIAGLRGCFGSGNI
jgi:UDP-N-acetylmuramyl pentapeptide phosphotransferase/UDP-N-acetylglucosamine-1-phosphate transferase